jgi:hypothetical protein
MITAGKMQIFRLDPVASHLNDPRWTATDLKEGCWVRAQSQDEARRRVTLATVKVVGRTPGADKLLSPWLDPYLTECAPDSPGVYVPDGIVVSVHGRTYP